MKEAISTVLFSAIWIVSLVSAFQMGRHWTMAKVYGCLKASLGKTRGYTHEEASGAFKFCDEINHHIEQQKL